MNCSQCGHHNEPGGKFCEQCGNRLQTPECRQCGSEVKPGDVFCANCGAKQTEDVSVEPERETSNSPLPERPAEQAHELELPAPPAVESAAPPFYRKKWFIPAVSAVAIVAIAAALWLAFSTKNVSRPISSLPVAESGASKGAAAADQGNVTLSIESIDAGEYPKIRIKLAAEGEFENVSAEQIAIRENQQPQQPNEINPLAADKKLEVVYETTVANSNPPNGEKRVVDLEIAGNKLSESYESPGQTPLKIGDISYNTDQYPKVSVFFSLYDENGQPLAKFIGDPSAIKIKEGDTEAKNVVFSKLSEKPQAISTNLVIDVSGSMSENDKLVKVKAAATSFLQNASFAPDDVVAYMSFSDMDKISQSAFTKDVDSIAASINELQTDGCTALYEALNQAISNTAYNNVTGTKYVVAFSDGKNNICDGTNWVSPKTVINNAVQWGVPIYAVSVEEDDDLKRIAEETNGKYRVLGSDLGQLNDIYNDIFNIKKNQYVLTYDSSIGDKTPRQLAIQINSANHFSNVTAPVTPKLLDNREVSEAMQNYQIAWSQAMNSHLMDPLVPYVTLPASNKDKSSVYNIVDYQINGDITSSGSRSGGLVNLRTEYGESVNYAIPDYKLINAKKLSEDHYQMRVEKRVQRDATVLVNRNKPELGSYAPLTTYKVTAYTYNVIRSDGTWKVDSVEDDEAIPICYADGTYSKKYARQDGKSSKANGNCPGVAPSER